MGKLLEQLSGILVKIANFLVMIVLILITVFLATNVVTRYVFGYNMGWIHEFAGYGLVWITFLSVISLFMDDGHFQVDVLVEHGFKKFRALRIFINVLKWIVLIGFLLYLSNFTTEMVTLRSYTISFRIHKGFIYSIIPICLSLSTIIMLRNIFLEFQKKS